MSAAIPIIHRFDDRYALPAAVSFRTMLRHANPTFDYALFVVHSDISVDHQRMLAEVVADFPNAQLEFIVPDQSAAVSQLFTKTRNQAHFSPETYWSLLLDEVFPSLDRAISTDVDVMWLGDISEVWVHATQRLTDAWHIAGVRNVNPKAPNWLRRYYEKYREDFTESEYEIILRGISGGLLVLRLDLLRETGQSKNFMDFAFANGSRLRQVEQDVINLVAHEEILGLPLHHMVCTYVFELFDDACAPEDHHYSPQELSYALANPIQLHFAGGWQMKPWENPDAPFASRWIAELTETPFLGEWLDRVLVRRQNRVYRRQLASVRVPTRQDRRISLVWHAAED